MNKKLLHLTLLFLLIPLYGHAEEIKDASTTPTASSTKISLEDSTSTPEKSFTICSQEAIENRDTKIAQARTLYNSAMSKALTERKNREKAAVAIENEDDKKDTMRASVELYKSQSKLAQTTLTQARKSIWQTFETDIKKCRDLQQEESSPAVQDKDSKINPVEASLKKIDDTEVKTIKESIKAQFESLKSLFN